MPTLIFADSCKCEYEEVPRNKRIWSPEENDVEDRQDTLLSSTVASFLAFRRMLTLIVTAVNEAEVGQAHFTSSLLPFLGTLKI